MTDDLCKAGKGCEACDWHRARRTEFRIRVAMALLGAAFVVALAAFGA